MARKKLPPELKAKNHTFKLYDWEVEAVKKYIQAKTRIMNTRKHIAAEKGGTARFIISTDRRDR